MKKLQQILGRKSQRNLHVSNINKYLYSLLICKLSSAIVPKRDHSGSTNLKLELSQCFQSFFDSCDALNIISFQVLERFHVKYSNPFVYIKCISSKEELRHLFK